MIVPFPNPSVLNAMKTKPIIILIVAALSPVAMLAQSPSSSASPKTQREDITPPIPPRPPAPPHDNRPKEPVTFLGVETSQVPRVLSEQLGLPKGFGLVVDYVVPDSPAAAAGVQQNDIMRMLNDQILLEPGQLAKLVRSFNEGTTINLTLLRKGKEVKVAPKLTKHDAPQPHGPFGMGFDHEWKFDDGFEKMNMNFRDLDLPKVRDDVNKALHEAELAGDEARRAARQIHIFTKDDGTMKATKIDLGKAQIVFSDKQGELKLETVDGKKILTAKDAQGRLLFSGPIDTKEELDKIPADVRRRYDKLEQEDLPPLPPPPDVEPMHHESDDSAKLQTGVFEQADLKPLFPHGWSGKTVAF